MKGANRLTTGFMGGVLACNLGYLIDRNCKPFWFGVILSIVIIIFILILCELFSKDEYSGTWINGVKYDLDGIEICSFLQEDKTTDYTVGYASHRQLLTPKQVQDFEKMISSLKGGINNDKNS